jgi:hypothetical protein
MTQMQLDCQIARITGEPLSTVNLFGFTVIAEETDDLEPEDVVLVLDCPFCRQPVPYPGLAGDGSMTLAECDRCDVYFEFNVDEVYARVRCSVHGPANEHAVSDIDPV